jgi:hypothetical protein
MDDVIDAVCATHADLEQLARLARADEHHQVVEAKHTDWMSVGVKHVGVVDPVAAGTLENDRQHGINIT